jgi:hypothetical protein
MGEKLISLWESFSIGLGCPAGSVNQKAGKQ